MKAMYSSCPALAVMMLLSGCMTGPSLFERDDEITSAKPGSAQWWAQKAQLPSGVRQRCEKGKLWPARPRPTGERQQFTHTFHSEHYWPLPYVCQDRQYMREIIEVQTMLGWQEETTLYYRHFDFQHQTLTRSGILHLERIIETTPLRRRAVFVQATGDPVIDTVRLSSVETAIAEMTHGRETVPVALRDCREYGRLASEVKEINDLYNASIPAPRLGGFSGSNAAAAAAAPAPTP